MIYYKCPSCGCELANRQKQYDTKLKEINESSDSIEQKNILKTQLINSLKLKKICCKMRVMMKHDLINIIQPPIY
jgi:DNA-directed RNA polymerase subunit N (RpoN/RPB10)